MNDGFDFTFIVFAVSAFVALVGLAFIFANRVPPSRRKFYAWGCVVLLVLWIVTVAYALDLGKKRHSERSQKEILNP